MYLTPRKLDKLTIHMRAVASAAVFVLLNSLPLYAADVPIVQGTGITLGAKARQLISPPVERGYTVVSAKSSNPQVVQINGVTLAGGAWGVNFTVMGSGVGVVIVMWKNPTTGKVQMQYFVVASGVRVNGASRIVMSTGDTMPVPAPNALAVKAYALDNREVNPLSINPPGADGPPSQMAKSEIRAPNQTMFGDVF